MGASIEQHVHCRGCGHVLRDARRDVADGCICNAVRGVNHGLVPRETCTCVECDPAQTGSATPKSSPLACYQCGNAASDTCPLCHRSVCGLCAEREGESCCDADEPVSPPPPTENARAGADEHDEIARIFVTGWVPGFSRESRECMISQLASQLRGAHNEGLAAGRARGIEEERKRCEGIVAPVVAHYKRQILVEQQSGAYQGEVVATAKHDIAQRIADAIAKGGTP